MLCGAVCCPCCLTRGRPRCLADYTTLQEMALDAVSARCLSSWRGQTRSVECVFIFFSWSKAVASAAARHGRRPLHALVAEQRGVCTDRGCAGGHDVAVAGRLWRRFSL